MEINPVIFWNVVLTLIIAPAFWTFRTLMAEVKRIDILLNRTREDYATKSELQSETKEIKELILRLEVKLDRFIEKNNG